MKTPTKIRKSRGALTLSNTSLEESILIEAPHAPTDIWNLVKICMFLMGISTMLAESMLLSIGTYYKKEYPNFPHLVYFVLPAYAVPNLLFLIIMIEHGSKIAFKIRIIGTFIIQAVILILIPKRNTSIDAKYMIICYALIGMNTAICNCSILGFMNLLNANYQQLTLSGQAFAGIIASILRIATRYFYPSTITGIEDSTQIFFYFGAGYYIISVFIAVHLICSKYIQHQKNIFAMSIAAYFQSIKEETVNKDVNDAVLTTPKRYTRTNGTASEPLELTKSESEPISSYKKMSYSKTVDTMDKTAANTLKNSKITFKPSKYQRIKNDYHHLTLTHLAALQKQNDPCKIYVTDAIFDLIYSKKKINKNENVSNNSVNVQSLNVSKLTSSSRSSSKMFAKISFFSMAYKLYPKLYAFCYAIFLLNLLTWAVFPGLISGKIQSEFDYIANNNWMSILLSTEYFVCNFIARLILSSEKVCNFIFCCCGKYDRESYKGYIIVSCACCKAKNFIINAKRLTIFAVVRIIIIYPLFFLIYIGYFHNFNLNWISHVLMSVVGLTHGYIYCIIYMSAPQFCARHYREAAVSLLRFFHFCGVLVGSILALALSFIAIAH